MPPFAGFDWDEGNAEKCQRHGLSRAEVEALFRSAPRLLGDPAHSRSEERLIAMGRSASGRPVFVAFTLRELARQRLVRPISARYMHAKEAARYAETDPAHDDGRGG